MKLIGYEEFIRMPAGTIFAPYRPYVLEDELEIKVDHGHEYRNLLTGETQWVFDGTMPLRPWLGDYCELYNIGDQEEASFEIYDGDSNDARDYDMFLVFEEADIDRMIDVLKWAKSGCTADYKLSKWED